MSVGSDLAGVVRVVQRQVNLVDPHVCTDDRDKLSVLFSIYEALVRRSSGPGYEPCLAESWTVAEQARVWTFRLRTGATFHDGSKLRPSDVIASLERVRDPNMSGELGTQGVYRSYLHDAIFESTSSGEVRIVLGQPMADLLDLLTDLPIAPAAGLGEAGVSPVGSGPYRVLERSEDQVLLGAFDTYWGGRPAHDLLHWQAERDAERRLHQLLSGAADIVADVYAGTDAGTESTADDARFRSAPSSVCTAFMCNIKGGGATASAQVRQALNHALDVPRLIDEVLPGQAVPLTGPLTSRHLGYDPETPAFDHDPAKALRLLAEAGHPDGIELTLDVPTRLPDEATALARAMTRQYAEVGIDSKVKVHTDRDDYALMVRDGRLSDAACFDSSPLSTYRVLREKFHSGHRGPWWLGYANPEVDSLIDLGQETIDPSERQRIYRQAYRSISADAPWIFLYNQQLTWGVGPRLASWTPPVDGRVALV